MKSLKEQICDRDDFEGRFITLTQHHAEPLGWPQGDDEGAKLQRIDIATDLADALVYVAKE